MQTSVNKKEAKKQNKNVEKKGESFLSELMGSMEEARDFARGHKRPGTRVTKKYLKPVTIPTAKGIRNIRNRINRTQVVFSEMLGVTPNAVEAWESGKNKPSKIAYRMMQLLESADAFFKARFRKRRENDKKQ